MMATKITGAIKIYPNPVQRGEQFSIALKLKEAGLYQLLQLEPRLLDPRRNRLFWSFLNLKMARLLLGHVLIVAH